VVLGISLRTLVFEKPSLDTLFLVQEGEGCVRLVGPHRPRLTLVFGHTYRKGRSNGRTHTVCSKICYDYCGGMFLKPRAPSGLAVGPGDSPLWTLPRLYMCSSASLGLTDHLRFQMLGMRCKSVNFGAGKGLGSPNWPDQIVEISLPLTPG